MLLVGVLAAGCAQKAAVKEDKGAVGQVPPQPQPQVAAPAPAPRVTERPGAPVPPQGQARQFDFRRDLMLADVQFEFDKARLTAEGQRIARENAEKLKGRPQAKIQIEGHADERGTAEYNLALGDRRAASVRVYLAQLGIAPDRIFTISYGEERPADPGHNEGAWAKNRRAHFLITNP
ncbi:MAG: peptidoglycan-associated lipoprotein Pal [Candidatus Tectomicrobia bacterium]|nr:peptidoglycan-associated lipoprotein Pal [Candidatus Tectomicrobia bacterium]